MIYYIGLGSNLGNRLQHLKMAKQWLSEQGMVQKQSSVYETAAWGKTDQKAFYNAVVRLNSTWRPFRLLRKLKAFETQNGRIFTERWGPRPIDLDILLWEGPDIDCPILTLPHTYLTERAFVLYPLVEIEPRLILNSGLNIRAHLQSHFPDVRLKKIAEKW